MNNSKIFQVIIVGGSYAGLSAAMALGRSLRRVLIIDSGFPCNRQTSSSHNFLTQDGEKPNAIAEKARAQVLKYDTVQILQDIALGGEKTENGFIIITQSGKDFVAKKLIFATGIKDIMPDIKGFAECWGVSVVHCPYCHGYELRNMKTGIIANGEKGFHLAALVHNLTNNITILTTGKADFNSEQLDKLNKQNIKIVETKISELENKNGYLQNVVFEDDTKISFDAAYAGIPFIQHSNIPVSLGCELTEHGYIKVDDFQKTTIQGVYACGDNTNMMRSVANAVYRGNLSGAVVNGDLTNEQF